MVPLQPSHTRPARVAPLQVRVPVSAPHTGWGGSSWPLAKAVSTRGHLGVVSGTALDSILARKLQVGDPGGHLRRAIARFPDRLVAERALRRYFVPGGKPADRPFENIPMYSTRPPQRLVELTVLANFVEVYLAKEAHSGRIGINYLEKIQAPNLASLYGAMLAGVDYVPARQRRPKPPRASSPEGRQGRVPRARPWHSPMSAPAKARDREERRGALSRPGEPRRARARGEGHRPYF